MRAEIVPVDLVSEQKVILGLASVRQLIYVFVGGTMAYNLFGVINSLGLGIVFTVITWSFLSSPIAAVVYWLGFWKREKDDMFWDKYLLIKLQYLRHRKDAIYRYGDDLDDVENMYG